MAFFGNTKSGEDYVINQLSELFGNTLDMEVIKNVAIACKYDVMESSNKLVEISSPMNKPLLDNGMRYSTALASGTSSTCLSKSSSCTTISSSKSKKCLDFERCVNNINKGYKVMILLRGLPGSGKSTLARNILEHTIGYDANYQLHILSTDDYFYQNPKGVYEYDRRKIEDAHNWNQNRAFQATSRGFSPVIIDNTNTKMWELKAYASMAVDYGYILEILEPDTHWSFNALELAKRNTHNVTKSKIKDMLENYEKNVTPTKLLSAYKLYYAFQKPPQPRLYPPINVVSNDSDVKNWSVVKEQSVQPMETINLMNFDDIEEDPQKNTNLPKSNENDIFVISSDEENEFPNKDNLYTQWGVNEMSLKSWDVVTPLQDTFNTDASVLQLSKTDTSKIEKKDVSVCTEDEYFRLARNDDIHFGTYDTIKVIETVNRDINFSTPRREPNISLKLTLDKSCMTEDIYEDCTLHLAELESLFPSVPKNHLMYWYNKCKGDLEWTIEFLLEAKEEVISLIEEDDLVPDVNNHAVESNKEDTEMSDSRNENLFKKKVRKSCNTEKSQEEKIIIKKMLESKFDIGGEHYSEHLRKIKQYKLKNTNDPSTSAVPKEELAKLNSDISVMKVEDVITIDSDVEFDDVDADSSSEISIVGETIELNLGETFVSQLEEKFADPGIQYPKGLLPVVQMPVNLAKQLYTFYLESVYQQMENQQQILETLVKEDEEFAKKLQAKEQEEFDAYKPPPVPNLKEIMNDQRKAQIIYQTEVEKWKNFSPDTLAAKLTKQKLIKSFPNIPENVLLEILNAHDNKYKETVETILVCTGLENIQDSVDIIKEPPIKEDILIEMKEAQEAHSNEERSNERLKAESYRDEATKYLRKRTDLYQKAQKYFQKGMTEVAQFYSGLASLQTIYYDRANNMAAATFLDEHSKRLQDFNTLDLHFLYVKEAIPALDMFLDTNINLLRLSTTKNSEYLQIITGRGKRSENGISRIKPAVISRLTKRGVKYVQLNPGLLKVKIGKTSLVTSEIPN